MDIMLISNFFIKIFLILVSSNLFDNLYIFFFCLKGRSDKNVLIIIVENFRIKFVIRIIYR